MAFASRSVTGRTRNRALPSRRGPILTCIVAFALTAFALPARAQNAIVTENQLAGTAQSTWDVSGAGDLTIQGFATDISVNKGETVRFKAISAEQFEQWRD